MGRHRLGPRIGDHQWRLQTDRTPMVLRIKLSGQSYLPQIALTAYRPRLGLGRGQCGQQHRRQNSDHSDHHQQLHQGERLAAGDLRPHWMDITNIIERAPSPSQGTILTKTDPTDSVRGQYTNTESHWFRGVHRDGGTHQLRTNTHDPNREPNPRGLRPTTNEASRPVAGTSAGRQVYLRTFAQFLPVTRHCASTPVPASLSQSQFLRRSLSPNFQTNPKKQWSLQVPVTLWKTHLRIGLEETDY